MANQTVLVTYQFTEEIQGDHTTIKHDIERARAFHERFIRVKAHKQSIVVTVESVELVHDDRQVYLDFGELVNGNRDMVADRGDQPGAMGST